MRQLQEEFCGLLRCTRLDEHYETLCIAYVHETSNTSIYHFCSELTTEYLFLTILLSRQR